MGTILNFSAGGTVGTNLALTRKSNKYRDQLIVVFSNKSKLYAGANPCNSFKYDLMKTKENGSPFHNT